MVTRRKTPPAPTVAITEAEMLVWLRARIGGTKHEAFAAEYNISRQHLSMVLSGRRPAGASFLRKLLPLGLLGVTRTFTVTSDPQ